MSTTIESLELEIKANSEDASRGINALADSLEKLKLATKGGLGLSSISKQIKGFNDEIKALNNTTFDKSKVTSLVEALAPLSKMSKSNLSSFITPLKSLPKVFEELSKVDMSAFTAKIQEITTALKPLADEMEKVANGFSSFPTKIQKLLKSTDQIPSSNKKASTSFTDLYHKASVFISTLKTVGSAIYSFIETSSKYNEVVNLFSVSMGQYATEAFEYANTVSEVMGIDPAEWMKSQGVFMTLATGFGVAGDRAATMSKNLTQLGYDLSSFQDISVEDAMTKLKSGLAGELEPLRAIGYDLSQAKLEATALELGIGKSVSEMTQAEKAQLRYYAIMTQVTTTHGDMARTLESPANQMRVFRAQIEMTARSIGNIFIPILQKILPYCIAVTKVIREMTDAIATWVGYEAPEIDSSGATAMSDAAESTSSAMEESTESAKKLKSYMMGFDELNVINPNTDSAENASSSEWDFELPEYDFLGEASNEKIEGIIESIKNLGAELEKFFEPLNLSQILTDSLNLLGNAFEAIGKAISSITPFVSTLMESLSPIIEWISAGISDVLVFKADSLYTLGELFVSLEPTLTSIGESLGSIIDVVWELIEPLLSTAWDSAIGFLEEIRSALVPIIDKVVKFADVILKDLSKAFDSLSTILKPLADFVQNVFSSVFQDILSPALADLTENILPMLIETAENLWNNVLVPLGELIGSVLTPIINVWAEVLTFLWTYAIVPLTECIRGGWFEALKGIFTILDTTVIPILGYLIDVLSFLWESVLSPIVDFVWELFLPAFEEVFIGIKDVIDGISGSFQGLIDFIVGVFTGDWKKALRGLLTFVESFVNAIIDGWNAVKRAINSLQIEIPEWLGGGTVGFNLQMTDHIDITKFADGGFPEQGQLFVAREAGAEMVGNIGRRTAVANNDQIVSGIAGGVAEANEEQNVLLREQNSLLRAILEKDSGVYLDGKNLTNSVEKYQRERGRVLVTGGVM